MAGFTNAEAKATLDARFPTSGGSDHVAYSANGTSETGVLARTPVGAAGWAAATTADPSVKQNSAVLTSAAATGSATLTHFAIFTASTGGTQRTDWTALAVSKPVASGDAVVWNSGDLKVTLT